MDTITNNYTVSLAETRIFSKKKKFFLKYRRVICVLSVKPTTMNDYTLTNAIVSTIITSSRYEREKKTRNNILFELKKTYLDNRERRRIEVKQQFIKQQTLIIQKINIGC